jgi:hypothetical protein
VDGVKYGISGKTGTFHHIRCVTVQCSHISPDVLSTSWSSKSYQQNQIFGRLMMVTVYDDPKQ